MKAYTEIYADLYWSLHRIKLIL